MDKLELNNLLITAFKNSVPNWEFFLVNKALDDDLVLFGHNSEFESIILMNFLMELENLLRSEGYNKDPFEFIDEFIGVVTLGSLKNFLLNG